MIGFRKALAEAKADQARKLHAKRVLKEMKRTAINTPFLTTFARTKGEMMMLASQGWQISGSQTMGAGGDILTMGWIMTLDRALI